MFTGPYVRAWLSVQPNTFEGSRRSGEGRHAVVISRAAKLQNNAGPGAIDQDADSDSRTAFSSSRLEISQSGTTPLSARSPERFTQTARMPAR